MTDRELLELAAKAAGVFMRKEDWPYSNPLDPEFLRTFFDPDDLSITGTRLWYGSNGDIGGTEQYTWRPLTDDGAALRLMAKLRLQVDYRNGFVGACKGGGLPYIGHCPHDDESPSNSAATRRAIVRAAAEIGKAM